MAWGRDRSLGREVGKVDPRSALRTPECDAAPIVIELC
jgi:hypothetical protein